jgi:glutamate dehydrogenase
MNHQHEDVSLEATLDRLKSHYRNADDVGRFAQLFLAEADQENLSRIAAPKLAALIEDAYAFQASRPPASHQISIRRVEGLGSDGDARSVVQIVNDDMPFLVDSVLGELQAQSHSAYAVLHPIMKVERSRDGTRQAIIGRGDENWGDGLQESFFFAIIEALSDEDARALRVALGEVLEEIRVAVIDWQPMLSRMKAALQAYERTPPRVAPGILTESLEFCRWLIGGQFTFLGMREYKLVGGTETGLLQKIEDSGLGVLRNPNVLVLSKGGKPLEVTPEIREHMFAPQPLIITKSDIRSRVHRRIYMDFIGLKTYGADGQQSGELRIVGLFTSQAYTERPSAIPFLRQKVNAVLRNTGYAPGSHDAKAVVNVLENFPREELFRIGDRMLANWARAILDLDLRPRVRLLMRRDRFDRFVSALVYIPRERFSTRIRVQVGNALARALDGRVSAFTPFFPEASLIRVHYLIGRTPHTPVPDMDVAALEAEIDDIAQMWSDRFVAAMDKAGARNRMLIPKYRDAFSSAYAETFPARRALDDVERIERLGPLRSIAVDFHKPSTVAPEQVQATILQFDTPIPLSERVPVLENFGLRSIDERSYRVAPKFHDGERQVALHDMVLATADGSVLDIEKHHERLEEAFVAVRNGLADNDPFNRLVVAADADWREAAMLRAYAAYMRQIRAPYGMRYVSDTLLSYPALSKQLIALFRVRFDPTVDMDKDARRDAEEKIHNEVKAALADVPSLDEDRILTYYLDLISATQRTNFFRTGEDGGPPETISFKIAPREVASIPAPRPFREIWCYSTRIEGVHLRFGPIARGGLRWSDRAQDFRTEVLGLCKAQQVKNTVIVPEGSKGGFFPKRLPRDGSREAVMEEAIASYRIFVSALLEITDNLVDGAVVPPYDVIRHDGDDPYLVVAADKGTATFSDFANEISTSKGFWLGDAFASGGSAGYDHKKMGITARGAWESVKRHFREMDIDIQSEPFSAIGVGDMSGDVFGNGMLLSEKTRLLAAFDHRDIFIDPDPDPVTSFAERKRLFDMGRSSWQDYDTSKLSVGGGVFPRSSKSIRLTPQIRSLLEINADEVAPSELLRAILKSQADLLWFGGIGTYVRAGTETDADAGDRANDPIRIAANELRVKVIGEGANLGVTQAGRIAFAQAGGRINTDFIDNSAGVNSSDKEVNIKIAVGRAVADGRLDMPARNQLLASMTEDVAGDCLWNNYQQSLAISLAERRGVRDGALLARLMRQLEERGLIARDLEVLPSDPEIAARLSSDRGFTRPEIAVLMSWAKIALTKDLMQSTVPEDLTNESLLFEYFPEALRQNYHDDIAQHRLRREIIVTRIANSMINRAGPAMVVRIKDATGRDVADIAAAFMAARTIYDLPGLWAGTDALDNKIKGHVQLDLYSRTQGLLLDQSSELLRLGGEISVSAMVGQYGSGVAELSASMANVLTQSQNEEVEAAKRAYVENGVPADLAQRVAQVEMLKHVPSIVKLSAATNRPLTASARLAYEALEYFRVDELEGRARGLHVTDYYDRLALSGALGALRSASRALTRDVLRSTDTEDTHIGPWIEANGSQVRTAKRQIEEIAGSGELTISRLTVAAAQIRELASEI